MKIFTIGFTKKKSEYFFEKLISENVKRIIDIRLNNKSQLAGFTKIDDFPYFLKKIGNIDYEHLPELAPTQSILDNYKKHKGEWSVYETEFNKLLVERINPEKYSLNKFQDACLLCSEDKPHYCHRRLVAEYLKKISEIDIEIIHLV
jgi:uncharacterized protein (DUF488 family)